MKSIWRGEKVELRAKTREDIPRYVADGVADDMQLYGDGFVCNRTNSAIEAVFA